MEHLEWKLSVLPLLKRYAERTPGVLLEETEGSYTWNYRAAGPYGAFQAKDLRSIINSLICTSILRSGEISDIDIFLASIGKVECRGDRHKQSYRGTFIWLPPSPDRAPYSLPSSDSHGWCERRKAVARRYS